MSQLPHIFYPSPGDEESYFLGCRKFDSSKSAQEEWEKVTRHLQMSNRGREFIREEFARLLQDWYQPPEGLALAEVQVYGGDAHLVIGKVLKEFALMQAKYKLLTNPSPLLENDDSSKPVPGYDPGNTMGTGDQEPHTLLLASLRGSLRGKGSIIKCATLVGFGYFSESKSISDFSPKEHRWLGPQAGSPHGPRV
ncbi:hypothetical protein DSO57_1027218 [Entomophthora muscae]|uniref:Uncharacterized protein n=1 Tax=Entomophthora muscae TaxID=34485 RepID=A0ACC2UMD1_9FUNG|nr:hypothetical protein DSO57_1027218 [Entomophthora muscae]